MTEDIITRIEQAIGCQQCTKQLKADGPSPDFCSEACQGAWYAKRADTAWPESDSFARAPGLAWGWMTAGINPGDTVTVEIGGFTFDAVVSEAAPDGFALVQQMDNCEATFTPDLDITIGCNTTAFDRAFARLSRSIRRWTEPSAGGAE